MAMNVKFLKGTFENFGKITTKDPNTFYYLTDKYALYLGDKLIGDGVSSADFEALKNRVTNLETWKTQVENWQTVTLPAIYVTQSTYNTHLTTQDERDDGQDELIAGLRADLNELGEIGGEPNKVNDVTVNGQSVVVDKVAAIKTTSDYAPTGTEGHEKLVTQWYLENTFKGSFDSSKTSDAPAEAGKGIQVTVTQTDGAISAVSVSGNYDKAYDALGAAATAEENAKDYTDSEIEGLEFNLSEDGKTLELKNKNGTAVASLDTTDFVVDGMLSSVVADQVNNKLTFTWNTDSGIKETVIELSSIADIYTGEKGIIVTNENKIGHTNNITAGSTTATSGQLTHGGNLVLPVVNYDANGHITSVSTVTAVLPAATDISGKADKVSDATAGNFAGLDSEGNLTDSGKKAADFVSSEGYIAYTQAEKTKLAGIAEGAQVNVIENVEITCAGESGSHSVVTATISNKKATLDISNCRVQYAGYAENAGTLGGQSPSFYETAGTAAGLIGSQQTDSNAATGVYAAIQGATTNTVKDCVDAINTMNNKTGEVTANVQNIVNQLTWGSF